MEFRRYGTKKIFRHPKKLQSFLEDKIASPIYVRIKPTNRCNHHCRFCSYEPITGDIDVRDELNRTDEIPKEKMMEILSDFKDMGVKAVTYSGGGEPLVYPHISEVMRRTLENNIDLSIITNGQLLNGERADILTQAKWVRVSLDTSDANSFAEIRKVPERYFQELTKNIETFANMKSDECELGINFVVHNGNANQVYKGVKHFKELGVNHIKITPMWISNFKEYHKHINAFVLEQIANAKTDFQDEKFVVYDTYGKDFSRTNIAERKYSRCYTMQTVPVVGANSTVYFCHDKAYSSSGVLGSIQNQSFKELWFSEETARKFREFNPQENCRHHCTSDVKNIQINKFLREYSKEAMLEIQRRISSTDINFV